MLLKFPFPESGERGLCESNMRRHESVVHKSMARDKSFARRLALVSVVFLVQVWAPGAAAASRAFGDVSGDSDVAVAYKRGSVSPRVQTLPGSPNAVSLEFAHFRHERKLLQVQPSTTTRPLAVRGDRRDPLNGFKKYRQGYDVKNKHYWASAIYTGVYGYAIGVAWLLLGLLLALAACCKLCCCRRERAPKYHSAFYYWLPRILVLLLSLFAIGCIITLFIRNRQFHTQAFLVRDSIQSSANDATGSVRNVSTTLSSVSALLSKYNIAGLNSIGSTVTSLNQQADSITNKVNSNIHTYNRLINGIEIALIVILAVALFLVLAGLISALMGWRAIFFLIILLGWLLTVLTWILFGLFFAVNNIASDTCLAFSQYLQAPANTTLDNLLPCVNLATASSASSVARQGVNNIIVQANGVVTQINQANAQLGRTNTVPNVCDPIGPAPAYTYSNSCPQGTVAIGQLPQVLQPYVCPSDPITSACASAGRVVTPTQNTTANDFSQGGQGLVSIIPAITSLTNCSFVYNTFNAIVTQRCSPAKHALRNLWIPLLLLSIALTLLTTSWLLANHRNKIKRHSGSVYAQDSPRMPK